MNVTVSLQLIASQYGIDIENIKNPDQFVTLVNHMTRVNELIQQCGDISQNRDERDNSDDSVKNDNSHNDNGHNDNGHNDDNDDNNTDGTDPYQRAQIIDSHRFDNRRPKHVQSYQSSGRTDPYESKAAKFRQAHEEFVIFCDKNQIKLSGKLRNLQPSILKHLNQIVMIENAFNDISKYVIPVVDFFNSNNNNDDKLDDDLRWGILAMKAVFHLFLWCQYSSIGYAIQKSMEFAENSGEIQKLSQSFSENAAKLKVRADYVNKLLKQFYEKVDKKEKQILLEQIRQELWDAHEKVFIKTKQAYDKLELKLRIELESIIKKKGISKVIGWVSSIGAVVAVVGAIIFAQKARREHGRILNGKFVRDPVKLFGYGAIVSGIVGYNAYQFENKQNDFEEILLEQMDQLKDIERNFGIICKEFKNFQDKSNELAETCQT